MTTSHFVNSEEYLTSAAHRLIEEHFAPIGMDTDCDSGNALADKLRVRVGYPTTGGIRASGATLGQCIGPQHSEGGFTEIFVNPRLSDPKEMLAVVVHELVHAAVGHKQGHGKTFMRALAKVGISGETAKTACTPSEELEQVLDDIINELGTMPHDAITLTSLPKKQTTRLLKVICINDNCPFKHTNGGKAYTVRMSLQTATDGGTPFCGACEQRMAIYAGQASAGGSGNESEETDAPIVMEPPPAPGEGESSEGEEGESDDEGEPTEGDQEHEDAEGEESESESEDAEGEESESDESRSSWMGDDDDVAAELKALEEYEAEYGDPDDTEDAEQDGGSDDSESDHLGEMEMHMSDGGTSSEVASPTLLKIAEAHPLDLDCECEACKAGRALAGL